MTHGPDDHTERMPADGDRTHRMGPVDDDETKVVRSEDDATQRMDERPVHEPTATQRVAPITAPVTQRTERIAVPGARPNLGPWLIAALVAIALIAGGVMGYTQTETSDDNVVARALVSPDGGVLTFDGVGRLEIPRGALPTATAITVRREKLDSRVRLGTADDPRSTVYAPGDLDVYVFEPSDLRFQQPVKITLPRRGDAEAVLVDSEDGARVIAAEANGNTVTLTTTSFSFDQS